MSKRVGTKGGTGGYSGGEVTSNAVSRAYDDYHEKVNDAHRPNSPGGYSLTVSEQSALYVAYQNIQTAIDNRDALPATTRRYFSNQHTPV